MFKKTIDALKATEAAAQADLDALWVPYDPVTGGGGVHWNAAGSGILQNAIRGVVGLREELEKRQTLIDAMVSEAPTKAEQVAAAEAQVAAANAALEAAKGLPEAGKPGTKQKAIDKAQADVNQAAKELAAAQAKSPTDQKAIAEAAAKKDAADTALNEAKALPEDEVPAEEAKETTAEEKAEAGDPTKLAPGEAWDATPSATKHAEATGVDIGQVEGTGTGGTVTKADVTAAAAEKANG